MRDSRPCMLSSASVVIVSSVLSAGVWLASPAFADPSEAFKSAVASARGDTSCGPLRYDPVVEQVAEMSNRSTDRYLNHATATVPVSDPTPGLKDLGYHGKKGLLLAGASKDEDKAIKAAILEGFDKLPDCSYTDFGVSMLQNQSNGYYLTALVLAGP